MKNFNKPFINPFDYINPEKIRNKVNTLKDRHPDWEKEDFCRELVKRKSRLCAGSGFISALPSSLPGLGTVVTIIGGTAVDLTALVYFLSELTMEIATVYDRDPSTDATVKEGLWVLSSCFGVESATVGVSKVAVINTSKKALAVIIEKLFTIIGGWLSKRIILRMLPVVGSLINSYINSKACKHVGKEVVLWYKTNEDQDMDWSKGPEAEDDFLEEDDLKDDIPDENIIFEPMDEDMSSFEENIDEDIIIEEPEEILLEEPEEILLEEPYTGITEEEVNLIDEEKEILEAEVIITEEENIEEPEVFEEEKIEESEVFEEEKIEESEVFEAEVIITEEEKIEEPEVFEEEKIEEPEVFEAEVVITEEEKIDESEIFEEDLLDPFADLEDEDVSVEIITPDDTDDVEIENNKSENLEDTKKDTKKSMKKIIRKKKKKRS